jgi:hypothetical protein
MKIRTAAATVAKPKSAMAARRAFTGFSRRSPQRSEPLASFGWVVPSLLP